MYKGSECNLMITILYYTQINYDIHEKAHIIVRPKHSSLHLEP